MINLKFITTFQLCCVSSSTELMNREKFPKHFQVDSADVSLSIGFYSIIQLGKWREIVLLYEHESVFTTVIDEIRRLLDIANVPYEYIRYDSTVNPILVRIKR